MNWQSKVDNLLEAGETSFWKPEAGQHTVEFLDEGNEHIFEWDGKEIPKVLFKVKVGDKNLNWDITEGKTANSLFGQIALIGATMNGIKGSTITLVVKGQGKEVTYTVLEALPLMKKVEEETVTEGEK